MTFKAHNYFLLFLYSTNKFNKTLLLLICMTYYDSIAEGYDELHKEEQLNKIELIKQRISIKRNEKVLDVGCGHYYGDWNGIVTGLDPSKKLLKKAKEKGIETINGKAENMSFDNDSFDWVISLTAVQNFEDIEKGLNEMKRVGSKFVISFLKRSSKSTQIEKLVGEIFIVDDVLEEEKDIIYFCHKLSS